MNKIINLFIGFISLAMAILLIICQHNLSSLFIYVSIYLLLLGICFLLKKSTKGLVSVSIGICGIVTYLIYFYKILPYYDCYTFMFCLTLSLTLFVTIIKNVIDRIIIYKIYSVKVEGKVVDLILSSNSKKEFYKPVIEYELNNKKYRVLYPTFKRYFIPKIGDVLVVLVDPEDNFEAYFLPERVEDIFNVLTTVFLIIVCIVIIVSLF